MSRDFFIFDDLIDFLYSFFSPSRSVILCNPLPERWTTSPSLEPSDCDDCVREIECLDPVNVQEMINGSWKISNSFDSTFNSFT